MSNPSIQGERPNINFHKYFDSIFIVVKKEVYRVFLWLYEGGTQYVGDYLTSLNTATPGFMKKLRLGAMEKVLLAKRELPVMFDINFLYTLLQHTCGLTEDTSEIWNKPQTAAERKSLEHTLFLLKSMRNKLCHDPQPLMQMTEGDLNTRINELGNLCSIIICEAGQKSNRAIDEVDKCVDNMKKALDEIRTKPTPSGYTAAKFAVIAKQEITNKHQHPSASSSTFVMPLIHSKGKTGRYEMPLKHFSLWRCEDGSLPVATVLQGDTGTGKTSICQYIFDSWVSCNTDISDLQDFDLVVPVQCCKVSTRNLVDFLNGEFLPDTISLCGREETCEFLKSLRILWLIDGFEEATVDATELLKKIEEQGTSHLLFITMKPQHRQDLIDLLTSKDKVCEVSLSGLSDEGIKILIQRILQKKEKDFDICEKNGRKFLADVTSLGKEMLMELKVPLKLELMLKLWQDGKLSQETGASLSLLYEAIMDTQSEKIREKIKMKSTLRETDIVKRVNQWIEGLWEVAFDMIMQKKFVEIDKCYQEKLETKSGSLPIYPEDCLSIFLQSDSVDVSGVPSYSFLHNSQQVYLATRHVCLLMEQDTKPAEVLESLLKQNILSQNRMNRNHIYVMLLQVVSHVALQQTIDEFAAEVLIELLLMCNEFNAFEVVQCAAYYPVLVKEVSKFIDNEWVVDDDTIKAAIALLEFVTPLEIVVDIHGLPKELQSLPTFLEIISKRELLLSIFLRLNFSCIVNDSCDRYLESVCSSDAKCSLLGFSGSLSIDGCPYLFKMPRVRILELQVSSNDILGKILCNLKHLHQLETLSLSLLLPVVKTPISCHEFKVKKFRIHLGVNMDVSRIKETALAISWIYQEYDRIILYEISASNAVKFIQILEKRNVRVKSIHQALVIREMNTAVKISYGPVPLIQPITLFYDQWKNTHFEMSENEMGVKKLRFTTDAYTFGNVELHEPISESHYKMTRF